MPSLLSRFASASQSLGGNINSPTRAFTIHISSSDPLKLTTVRPIGASADLPPLYTLTASSTTKPNIVMYYGMPSHPSGLGQGSFSSIKSTSELQLRGMPITLRVSHMSGNSTIESAVTGEMKWKVSQVSGSSLYLCDASGNTVAKFKSGLGVKTLELYVPCDDFGRKLSSSPEYL